MKTTKKACPPKTLWGYLGVQGAFVEPSRRGRLSLHACFIMRYLFSL